MPVRENINELHSHRSEVSSPINGSSAMPPKFSLEASPVQKSSANAPIQLKDDEAGDVKKDKGWKIRASGKYDTLSGTYTAGRFDRWSSIAKRFSTTVEELKIANPGVGEKVPKGTELIIPGGVVHKNPKGKSSKTWSVDKYKKKRARETGEKMSEGEEKVLAAGCIGITAEHLGFDSKLTKSNAPPLDMCYDTFGQALAKAQELNRQFKANGEDKAQKAVIFSKRFHSADPNNEYQPDKNGKVDMTGYDYKAKPGYVNFDYGFYDVETGKWWHANHSEPGMEVYESTLEYYSRALLDFNKQVFCVGIQPLNHE